MPSALALQCSTNCAMKTRTLGAGQFIEFIVIALIAITTAMITSSFHLYVCSSYNIHIEHVLFFDSVFFFGRRKRPLSRD